jgi:hypothetical protein
MPLADAFVSNDDAVKLITAATQPSRDLGGIEVRSIDVVKLAQLYALTTGKSFEDALPAFLPEAHIVSDDGPWIYRCPAQLQAMLAALHDPELTAIAAQWAEIPEFGLDRIPASTVVSILDEFVRLAQAAEQGGEHVYLWNSL